MTRTAFQKLKEAIWPASDSNKTEPGHPFLTPSEIGSLRRQLRESSADAVAATDRFGVKVHPRVTAIKKGAAKT
jgi:hypothetical protein